MCLGICFRVFFIYFICNFLTCGMGIETKNFWDDRCHGEKMWRYQRRWKEFRGRKAHIMSLFVANRFVLKYAMPTHSKRKRDRANTNWEKQSTANTRTIETENQKKNEQYFSLMHVGVIREWDGIIDGDHMACDFIVCFNIITDWLGWLFGCSHTYYIGNGVCKSSKIACEKWAKSTHTYTEEASERASESQCNVKREGIRACDKIT